MRGGGGSAASKSMPSGAVVWAWAMKGLFTVAVYIVTMATFPAVKRTSVWDENFVRSVGVEQEVTQLAGDSPFSLLPIRC